MVINPKNTLITLTKDDFVLTPETEVDEEKRDRERFQEAYRLERRRGSILDPEQAKRELPPDQYASWLSEGQFTLEGKRLNSDQHDAYEEIKGRSQDPESFEDEDEDDIDWAYQRVFPVFEEIIEEYEDEIEIGNNPGWDEMLEVLNNIGIKSFDDMTSIDKKVRRLPEDRPLTEGEKIMAAENQ